MFAAWEVGAWKALQRHFQPDLIVGASAGAWNGWAIAGGCSPDELARDWLDPRTGKIMQLGLHSTGILRPQALHEKARDLFARFQPRVPFGLVMVEVPRLRMQLVRGPEVTWRHLAATCAIPLCFPPVAIQGRSYVDGGLRAALPLWAAEEMGARRAVALNVLTTLPFRALRRVIPPRRPSAALEVIRLEPSQRLGPLRDAAHWTTANIERWIELGERDAIRAASSITM